jgi:hypothetical protein
MEVTMIAQTVYDICELSKATKVPFLMISNPGGGKTTGVVRFAEKNGYHLEVVIGSRSTPEELLGYQVNNGGSSLEHLDSQWWSRIVEYDKKKKAEDYKRKLEAEKARQEKQKKEVEQKEYEQYLRLKKKFEKE